MSPGGINTADDILYGHLGTRRTDRSAGRLYLPDELDLSMLAIAERYQLTIDDHTWVGAGKNWMAKGSFPNSWNLPPKIDSLADSKHRLAKEYLDQLEEYRLEAYDSLYETSCPISVHHQPGAEAVGIIESEDRYWVGAQELAVVETLAGSGGEWRFLSFYGQDTREEYKEVLYFLGHELSGSVLAHSIFGQATF